MENKKLKILKAYCKKTKRWFTIELCREEGEWRAVRFLPITEKEALLVRSEVREPQYKTTHPLPGCDVCGGRVVGGCKCALKPFGCKGKEDYTYCLYCKRLTIDYAAPTATEGYHEGDVVRLSQGQTVRIRYQDQRPLSEITVCLGWDPNYAVFGYHVDLDASVIVAGENGHELIYYADRRHPSGCVVHEGDNRTGVNPDFDPDVDDENITVRLDRVPPDRDRLIFLLNVFRSAVRGQTLDDAKNMYIKLYDPITEEPIIEYHVDANIKDCTALIVGEAYREGDVWLFRAIGQGSHAKKVARLAEEALACCRKHDDAAPEEAKHE